MVKGEKYCIIMGLTYSSGPHLPWHRTQRVVEHIFSYTVEGAHVGSASY